MIESGGYKRFDKLIVVWCEPAIQLQRLMLREKLDPSAAAMRIAAQMPQDEKKRFADFLIDTSNGFEDARRQAVEVFGQLSLLQRSKENKS
jgi:dephospho-CoA kinase